MVGSCFMKMEKEIISGGSREGMALVGREELVVPIVETPEQCCAEAVLPSHFHIIIR